MPDADENELVQSLLSDFLKYAEETFFLDMDTMIGGMKELVYSREAEKRRHRSVKSQECHGNLAWITNSLSCPQELTSSVLFFIADPSKDAISKDSEYVGLRCIICNAVIRMEVKRNGKPTRNTYVLRSHLDSQHYGLATSITSRYPTMSNLLQDYNWSNVTVENTFSYTEQTCIHTYFRKSKEAPTEREERVSTQVVTENPSQDKERRVYIADTTERKRNKRVLAALLLGIPIAWNTNSDQIKMDIIGALKIPVYRDIKIVLSDLIMKYQSCVKRYLEGFPFLSLCCDGWSVVKPAKSMEVFFATAFKDGKFKSVLIDCISMNRSTACDLIDTLEEIQKEYNLPTSIMVTTDGASNNKKAFEKQRAICSAHAISNVIAHMTSNCRQYKGIKNGVDFDSLKKVREHFPYVNTICTYLTGSKAREYKQFVEAYKTFNTDMDNSGCLPERISPTRWLGVAVQMRWILKYGLLFYRFTISNKDKKFDKMDDFLKEIEDSSFIVFMLERAMNLLTPSNKPTLHLVLPVREAMRTVLDGFKPKTVVGKAMKEMLYYELNEGCLTIPRGTYYDYCCTASVLYPGISTIASLNIISEWTKRANSLLSLKKAEWSDKNMKICTRRDKYYDLSSLRSATDQTIPTEEGLLNRAITPLKEEYQVVGRRSDTITSVFLSEQTDIVVGNKKMSLNKAQNELEEKERLMGNLDKEKSAISERRSQAEERIDKAVETEVKSAKRTSRRKKREKVTKRLEIARLAKRARMESPCLKTLSLRESSINEEYGDLRQDANVIITRLEWKLRQLKRRVDGMNQNKEMEVEDVEEEVEDVTECTPEYEKLYSFDSFSWNETFEGLPNPVQCLLETVLSVPATEAVCERFFRQTSLTVKRQYVTNMSNDTLRSIAMIKYNRDVFYAMCYGKDVLSAFFFVC